MDTEPRDNIEDKEENRWLKNNKRDILGESRDYLKEITPGLVYDVFDDIRDDLDLVKSIDPNSSGASPEYFRERVKRYAGSLQKVEDFMKNPQENQNRELEIETLDGLLEVKNFMNLLQGSRVPRQKGQKYSFGDLLGIAHIIYRLQLNAILLRETMPFDDLERMIHSKGQLAVRLIISPIDYSSHFIKPGEIERGVYRKLQEALSNGKLHLRRDIEEVVPSIYQEKISNMSNGLIEEGIPLPSGMCGHFLRDIFEKPREGSGFEQVLEEIIFLSNMLFLQRGNDDYQHAFWEEFIKKSKKND